MVHRVGKFTLLMLVSVCACAWLGAAAANATVETFGAEINQTPVEAGTCGFSNAAERPCVFVDNIILSQAGLTTSPCTGTITRFRLNGIPRPANHYALRVIHRNSNGSYTGTATSAPVSIATDGINEYATSLPVAEGESIGIDFEDSTEEHGIRFVSEFAVSSAVLFDFPADGTAALASIPSTQFYYLFNADVECGGQAPAPPAASPLVSTAPPVTAPAAAPSHAFQVLGLKKTTISLTLSSTGKMSVAEAAMKKKANAGAKAKPRLIRPSTVTAGPGPTKLKLALTAAAKARLREAGKVTVRTTLTFTPTGGTTAVQSHTFTVKASKKRK
jgi:hypothetical protein